MAIGEAGESLPLQLTPEGVLYSFHFLVASAAGQQQIKLWIAAETRCVLPLRQNLWHCIWQDGRRNPCRCSTIHAHGTHRSGHYNTETSRQYFQRNRNTAKLHRDG